MFKQDRCACKPKHAIFKGMVMGESPAASRRVSRRSARRLFVLGAVCAAWAAVFAILAGPLNIVPLELAELSLQDLVVRHGIKTATPANYVLLALDEASLDLSQLDPEEVAADPTLTLMSRQFPWSRAVYAAAIEKILAAGAKTVVLDAHFPLVGEGDAILRETLRRHPGRVAITSLYMDTEMSEGSDAVFFHPPVETIVAPGDAANASVGYANFWPEADKVVRAAHYRMTDADLLGRPGLGGEVRSSLGAVALRQTGLDGRMPSAGLIRFCAPGSFPVVPLWQLFVPETWKANLKDGAVFRDKIVLAGPLAPRFRDFFRTPVGTLPGPEIHLHAMAAAQLDAFYRRATSSFVMASCFVLGAAAFAVSAWIRRPLAALLVLVMVLIAYVIGAFLAYNLAGFLPGLFYPGSTLIMAGLTCFGYDFTLERREKTRVRRSLERYVSRDVVRELLDHESDVLARLGGSRQDVAVLFSDLRGFTAITEHAEPAQLVADLNEYLGAMVEIVFRNRGTLDKFIGDAVMAVWGTVESAGAREDAVRSVRTAVEMLGAVRRMRRQWAARGAPDLRLGIGLNFGPAIFGNIGSELKMEPTVIGDTVNLASRLESLTKRYGVELIASGAVVEHASSEFAFRTIDTVRVVGRSTPVTLYTVPLSNEGELLRPAWLERHEEGWGHYRSRRFDLAVECFASALEEITPDKTLVAMIERCRSLHASPPPDDWEPVVTMESK